MKPIHTKIVTLILIILTVMFFIGVLTNNPFLEGLFKTLILFTFVLFYFTKSRRKNLLFGGFLCFLTIAEGSKVYFDFKYDLFSATTNTFFIVAYLLLIFYIHSNMNTVKVLKEYWLQTLFLFGSSLYILYNLNNIMSLADKYDFYSYTYLIENAYNVIILWLVSISLLSFLNLDNKRNMLIFIISACFGLAEIIQVPYMFLSAKQSLHIGYSLLYLMGYLFVYIYVATRYNKQFKILA